MTKRNNYLRCARLEGPDWIPCRLNILPAGEPARQEELLSLVRRYPDLFELRDSEGSGADFTDNWGVVWHTEQDGVSIPQHPPLADLSRVDGYTPPDPFTRDPLVEPRDLEQEITRLVRRKEAGELAVSGGGAFFARLQALVGRENLLLNMAQDDNPALQRVVDLVADFNYTLTCAVLDQVTPDVMSVRDDLGSVSPSFFRRWLQPGYTRCMQAARAAGCEVYLHSDGYLLELADDLIATGLTILSLPVGPNTLAGLEETLKGRLCLVLNLDQEILLQGTPPEVRDHVREAVQVLGSPRGGLMLQAEINTDVPLRNLEVLAEAMREYGTYYTSTATPL